jgi:hypothetical protein
MRLLTLLIMIVAFFVCSGSAMAQKPGKFFSIGFGFEAGKPLNSAASVYDFTGGLTVRISLHAGPGFATITGGGIVFVPWEISEQNLKAAVQIPIKGGYKYIFLRHFFVMGELGYSLFRYYTEGTNNNLVTTRTGGFTYAPSVGVQLGIIELGLRYETIQLNTGDLSYLGLRLGFNF